NPNVTGGIDYQAPPRYELTKYRQMAKRLPSGAGLIAVPPPICSMNINTWRKGGEVREQVIAERISYDNPPPVYWLDNVDDPARVEVYFGRDYYDHPNARILLHDVVIGVLDEATVADPRNEVGWIRRRADWETDWASDTMVFGPVPSARVIPRELWTKDQALVAALMDETRPVLLGPEGVNITVAASRLPLDIREADRSWPIFVEEGALQIRTDPDLPKGMAFIPKHMPAWQHLPYAIDGRLVGDKNWDQQTFYDPESGLIVRYWPSGIGLAGVLEPDSN
ncbi:MAG: hypothetical protein AAGH38_03940, partial [Pseudomonadota bacterium]